MTAKSLGYFPPVPLVPTSPPNSPSLRRGGTQESAIINGIIVKFDFYQNYAIRIQARELLSHVSNLISCEDDLHWSNFSYAFYF